ncbi:ABC transporter substrate-binding protein (plasmid) [Bradyrhizobium guangxiense]
MHRSKLLMTALLFAIPATALSPATGAEKAYGPGVTDTEIKIGSTMPLSGPASAFGILGKVEAAYFKKINDEGGINGRKVNLITYDDGYSPPKTVEQVRKLVESDEVLLIFSSLGTATNTAVQRYLNGKKVPQLFVGSRASKWNKPREFPWTLGLAPSYFAEGEAYAKYLLREQPNGKIAAIFQNDDFGKDTMNGLKSGLADRASAMIVAEEGYEVTEPTIESRVVKLKSSGADILINITAPKFAAQVIKKTFELNWKPTHILGSVSASIETVLKPAGMDISEGIISATYVKDGADPQWANDAEAKEFNAFLASYFPEGGRSDVLVASGYTSAEALVQVLKASGDDLTRENVMKMATNMKGVRIPMLLPDVLVNTSPDDYSGMRQLRLIKLDGNRWKTFGNLINVGSE